MTVLLGRLSEGLILPSFTSLVLLQTRSCLCIYIYRIFRPITRALSIQKRSKIVKNEHARYTLERFPTNFCVLSIQKRSKIVKNECARYTLGARYWSENTVYIQKSGIICHISCWWNRVSRTLEIHSALTHLITQGYFILLKMSHL
jgi:hypothetical protein